MTLFLRALALLVVIIVGGCGSRPPAPKLPTPVQSTQVGPGDLFEVSVLGEKDLPKEYRVQPDGSVDFPYLNRIKVAGLEPQEITDLIRKKLVEAKILQDPQVTLVVKQYSSKKVNMIGQVQKPGAIPWTDGLKLVEAVSQVGGFTSIADSNHVILTRQISKEKSQTVIISVDAITDGAQADIPLQAGDTIKVDARVF
jgi:polysaccharide biosynthesis/export protein VpsN